MWFDNLKLPVKNKSYITPIRFTQWYGSNQRVIEAVVPIFGPQHSKYTLYLTAYDLTAYVFADEPYWTTILLDKQDLIRNPKILKS